MGNDVWVLIERAGSSLTDSTYELAGKAGELAAAWGGRAVGVSLGTGDAGDLACDAVLTIEHPALEPYTPEAWLTALSALVSEHDPKLVLIPNTTVGMDLGAGLAARCGRPVAAYAVGLGAEGDDVVVTSQLYGGKLLAEATLDGGRGVCTVVAGSFPASAGRGGSPAAEPVAPPAGLDALATTFVAAIAPEGGDVDITASDLLVSIGRGIQSKDNVELAEEFADAIGAAVSASRPITDGGWLPKTRQVGKSGLKVKPRAYLAFGISGAPEHLEGMREAELIIACNTDEKAPIFDVAHYGTTVDLFDLLPALTEQVQG